MANFNVAFLKTVANEGGYVNNPNDKGGETYMGVTRKNYPDLSMWKRIDEIKEKYGTKYVNSKLKDNKSVYAEVQGVYRNKYWNPCKLDDVCFQAVANQIFDHAINAGTTSAIKLMQRIKGLPETGRMSEQLIKQYKRK